MFMTSWYTVSIWHVVLRLLLADCSQVTALVFNIYIHGLAFHYVLHLTDKRSVGQTQTIPFFSG